MKKSKEIMELLKEIAHTPEEAVKLAFSP